MLLTKIRGIALNHGRKKEVLWIEHVDGIAFRKLADQHKLSPKQTYVRVFNELKLLPNCLEMTKQFCEYRNGILIIDGKYIKVRGYKQKIPFIYGIDYETHDILFGMLVSAEDEKSFLTFFQALKALNYPLKVVVADDRSSLPLALKQVYSEVPLQLCLNHYLENVRVNLHIRTDPTHRSFFHTLKKQVFDQYKSEEKLLVALESVWTQWGENVPLRQTILIQIYRRRKELFAFKAIPNCPNNTNLIELFNSHFNARLKSLKGFKTKINAILWLNGLLIRRRTKPFTDCSPKFKHLNGKSSLRMSIKKQAQWPEILGVHAPKR